MALERSKCVVDGGSKVGLDGCKLFIAVVVSVTDKDVAVVIVAVAAGRDFDEEDFILI